ncbi:MAG TPA: ExeM/NucH family extracellular endonuclease, partial [Vicinamibacterales bacterium]|nr:ExeM/NucH family extracellular endonuclease [Vicinamibacterales bacterium]
PHVTIGSVQGSGIQSPATGQTVIVRGEVVGQYEGSATGALHGFYLQDLAAERDNAPATSDGIFVFTNTAPSGVANGQVVQVTGTVSEFGSSGSNKTEIDTPTVEPCGALTADVTPTDVTLPLPPASGGVPYLERFEGMLVRFHQTLYVTEHFQLGEFGQIVMSSGGRLRQPTSILPPGAQANALQTANDLNQIIVDDELNNTDPDPIKFGDGGNPLSGLNTLRGGDSATDIVGVVTQETFSAAEYHLRPINALGGGVPIFQKTNPRPTAAPTVGGRLKVVGMNVLNYFLTLDVSGNKCGPVGNQQECRGANTAEELQRQQAKLNAALVKLNGDIVGMSELENTTGVDPLADIVGRLNGTVGAGTYGYINTGTAGSDAIKVGIIYKPGLVTPVGAPMVHDVFVQNRAPVAQTFRENSTGEIFTVVVNHLRSKGCPTGTHDPRDDDQLDGQGCENYTRTQQAIDLLNFVQTTVIPAAGDPDVMLIGDFNSYAKEDPIRTIEQAGFTNVVERFVGPNAYSYLFDGEFGYIDHVLASTSMLPQVAGANDYHVNADEPSELDYNEDFKAADQIAALYNADEYRYSDHDPALVGVSLRAVPQTTADSFSTEAGHTLTVNGAGVLANDTGGALTIFSHTTPANGTLAMNADGSFTYTPNAGFTGLDTFSYTAANATPGYDVQLFSTALPPLATIGDVNITAGGYGSSLYPVPGSADEFYGLTDRGPNVDGPNGTKVEPLPAFTPAIGKVKLSGDTAILEQIIPLQAADGTPYSGRVNSQANTGETITDLNGNLLPPDPNGYDSEGLVALPDGTFWVSDEYGPFITHFDASGKQISRLSPFDGSLPGELQLRVPNKGMEGLTVTPDGTTLVGMMQSSLQQLDLNGSDATKLTPLRIVTYRLADGAVHEYLYLLDNPASTKTAVSEITAISNTQFLVDERDGQFEPGAYKKLYLVDISGATDVGPSTADYNAAAGGFLIGGRSIERVLLGLNTAQSGAALSGVEIYTTTKSLFLDVGGLVTSIDPNGGFFGHDKIEGVAALNGGATIVVSNDSDFGIDGLADSSRTPYTLHAKIVPGSGLQDDGEYLVVDLVRSTATVSVDVGDTTAPETTLVSTPPVLTNDPNATFTFGGSDAGGTGVAGFLCALDGATSASCASGISYFGSA